MTATFKARPRLTWSCGVSVARAENRMVTFSGGDGGTIAAGAKCDAKISVSNPAGAIYDACLWGQYKYGRRQSTKAAYSARTAFS